MSEEKQEREFFDVDSASEFLISIGCVGVSPKTIYGLIATDGLPAQKMGRRFYIRRSALMAWLEKRERKAR